MARILFLGLWGFRFVRGIRSRTGSSSSRARARAPVAAIVGSRCDPPLRCPDLPTGLVVQDTVPERVEDRSIVLRSVAVQLAEREAEEDIGLVRVQKRRVVSVHVVVASVIDHFFELEKHRPPSSLIVGCHGSNVNRTMAAYKTFR